MKSATTAGDSDVAGAESCVAESCVAESCASFEFVDEESQQDDGDAENEDGAEADPRGDRATSPPKLLLVGPEAKSGSAVCSPSSTSEIGSVFGLRFDPLENKMTLQLTAEPARSPQPEPDPSKLQPTRFPLELASPARSENAPFPSLRSQAKKSEYENATDDERKQLEARAREPGPAEEADDAEDAEDAQVKREQEEVRQILASAAALQAETSQSEWSEEDDSLSEEDSHEEADRDCQGPLLGAHRARKAGQHGRRKFHFGLASDVESTGYTTDDAGLENFSVFNDAGLTDAEGIAAQVSIPSNFLSTCAICRVQGP